MSEISVTQCSVCGGEITFPPETWVSRCRYCARMNSRPRSAPTSVSRLKYANERRNQGEFGEAEQAYREVLRQQPDEHEARWGLLLCKYGVIYVENASGQERLITCRRSRNSFFCEEEDFSLALRQAPEEVRAEYEKDGRYIDRVQAEIRRVREQMQPYDIFLCYKETDAQGGRTVDSVLAQQIHGALTRRGFHVFYAPVSLKEVAGANYEAAIFCAIESSMAMLVLGTHAEYYESTWVRSEWRRYLERIDAGDEKLLIPLYRDLSPQTDLPKEFRLRYWEGLDMANPGFLYDIEAILEKTARNNRQLKENSLELGMIYLEDGDFDEANAFFDEILQADPKNGKAWLGKVMAEEKARREEDLASLTHPLEENRNFNRALRFGDEETVHRIKRYAEASRNRAKDRIDQVRRRAEAGTPQEQVELGLRFEEGNGVPKDCVEAAYWYRKAAERGNAMAQFKLGWFYTEGLGLTRDVAQGFFWTKKAAEQGLAYAQANLSVAYENGWGVPQNAAEFVFWAQKAAEQGSRFGQYLLGEAYYAGKGGLSQNMEEAALWYRKAAVQGYASAQHSLGYLYACGYGVPKDDAEAITWFRKAAGQGMAIAQYHLALFYNNGRGAAKDPEKAAEWFLRAAEQGYREAQTEISVCYFKGSGLLRDDAKGAFWARKAAEQGDAKGQRLLGNCLSLGRGVKMDKAEATVWYRKAAEQGDAVAQGNLGAAYLNGQGVPRDDTEGFAWSQKAAEQGDANGYNNLGHCYYYGRSVLMDLEKAAACLRKAVELGDQTAAHNLKIVEAKLNK